ncbi:hypothetical protein HanHA300_Chr09g0316381 [Helianthus annuus]|nr:hypothetical protein HanHA300_Chr09g0316381 [Helianthus annuus]
MFLMCTTVSFCLLHFSHIRTFMKLYSSDGMGMPCPNDAWLCLNFIVIRYQQIGTWVYGRATLMSSLILLVFALYMGVHDRACPFSHNF